MTKRKFWTGTKYAPSQDRFFIDALDDNLWERGGKDDWDACWQTGMPAKTVFKNRKKGASLNHLPGNNSLTVKSRLHQTLRAAATRLPPALQTHLDFAPMSYLMPDDYHALQRDAFAADEKRWIVKPKGLSRGRGIYPIDDAGRAPVSSENLIQAYLDTPHLYDGHKYVLRFYLLITSIDPLRVYLHKEGFVKLASEKYNAENVDNLFAHLTNPDINAQNKAIENSVVFFSFDDYRDWLTAQGADARKIFNRFKEIAALTAIAAREPMRQAANKLGADNHGCYELIGMDCMVDADLKPWLLECNLSPSLSVHANEETGGALETHVKKTMVTDLVSLLGLNDASWPPEENPVQAGLRERANAGGFEPVFPDPQSLTELTAFFPVPRAHDVDLARAMIGESYTPPTYRAAPVDEHVFGDAITLHAARTHALVSPESAGAYVWLRTRNGDNPDEIARDYHQLTHQGTDARSDFEMVRTSLWNTLSEWGREGLLEDNISPPSPENIRADSPIPLKAIHFERTISIGGKNYTISTQIEEVAPRLQHLLNGFIAGSADDSQRVEILRSSAGYGIAINSTIKASHLRLSALAPALHNILLQDYASTTNEIIFSNPILRLGDRVFTLFKDDNLPIKLSLLDELTTNDVEILAGHASLSTRTGQCSFLSSSALARTGGERGSPKILDVDHYTSDLRKDERVKLINAAHHEVTTTGLTHIVFLTSRNIPHDADQIRFSIFPQLITKTMAAEPQSRDHVRRIADWMEAIDVRLLVSAGDDDKSSSPAPLARAILDALKAGD